jgi:hypothetical protein
MTGIDDHSQKTATPGCGVVPLMGGNALRSSLFTANPDWTVTGLPTSPNTRLQRPAEAPQESRDRVEKLDWRQPRKFCSSEKAASNNVGECQSLAHSIKAP